MKFTFGVKAVCEAVFGSTKGASVVDLAETRKGHAQGQGLETKMLGVLAECKSMIFKRQLSEFKQEKVA